jgi:hypothetical protein
VVVAANPHVSRIEAPYAPIVEITPDYSRVPIEQGFNWHDAFAAVGDGEWYLVAFRSRHRPDADHVTLNELDRRASRAASRYPGFMYYFVGTPRDDGHCLSFCLWRSRRNAETAAADPAHRRAIARGLPCFTHYALERYRLVKDDGSLRFEPLPASLPDPGDRVERPAAGSEQGGKHGPVRGPAPALA